MYVQQLAEGCTWLWGGWDSNLWPVQQLQLCNLFDEFAVYFSDVYMKGVQKVSSLTSECMTNAFDTLSMFSMTSSLR